MLGKKGFQCSVCGKEIEQEGDNPPSCCGKPMRRVWTTNFVVRKDGWGVKNPHDMNEFE